MSKIIEWAGHCGTLHHGNQLESKGEYQVLDCDLCSFKHVIPIPDEKFLEEYYSTQYFGKRGDEYIRKHENEYEWNKILFVEKLILYFVFFLVTFIILDDFRINLGVNNLKIVICFIFISNDYVTKATALDFF